MNREAKRISDKLLKSVRAGEMRFEEFVSRTRIQWRNIAVRVLKMWPDHPAYITVEDIEQDLLIGAWKAIGKYDPGRGTGFARYVVFNAMDRAKKELHKARGALRHRKADSNPSRCEVEFSRFGNSRGGGSAHAQDAEGEVPYSLQRGVVQDDFRRIADSEIASRKVSRTTREVIVVQAIVATGARSIADAADLLHDDRDAARICRIGSERAARREVRRVVRRIAARLDVAAA